MEIVSPGTRLRDIRKYFNLNQKQFCELLGIRRQNYLSRYETDEHEFDDTLKLKLVSVFQEKYNKRISLDWLITGNGDMFLPTTETNPIARENGAVNEYKEAFKSHFQELGEHLKLAEKVYNLLNDFHSQRK